ncbi:MAG: NAD(P)H-quinone oxidoreductase [Oligoflexia bacterium]|nr:NAD(P)H-quinone oxidoreductase [Oligoflexia bacterium]
MKFIECTAPGGPENLKIAEGPRPTPAADQVLIKVHAAGVNRPDLAQRAGHYPPPPGASPILGLEVSGVIEEAGEGSRWQVGDAVCALTPGGGYAEYCIAPAAHCLPIPSGYSFVEAAGIPETYFTVWANVFMLGRLQPGEKLLIHGGSSGIGTTAIQLARAFGAEVFATAGTDEKCQACEKLGAHAINYKKDDFVTAIKVATNSSGVNVILDMVGGDYTPRNIECLAPLGRLVQIATLHGGPVSFDLRKVMQKRLLITGSTLRPRSVAEKADIAQALLKNVWPLLENGKVKVIMDRVFRFEEAADAHRYLDAGENIGKITLSVIPNEKSPLV